MDILPKAARSILLASFVSAALATGSVAFAQPPRLKPVFEAAARPRPARPAEGRRSEGVTRRFNEAARTRPAEPVRRRESAAARMVPVESRRVVAAPGGRLTTIKPEFNAAARPAVRSEVRTGGAPGSGKGAPALAPQPRPRGPGL